MKRSPALALVPVSLLLLLSAFSAPRVWAQATLENPKPGSFQSGIRIISGWVCEADRIEIQFNGGPPVEAAYGTDRGDTRGACGDTDNGFGLLFNWNLLGDGFHTVRALADGVEFASVSVTVTTLGEQFLRGANGELILSDFPHIGTDSVVRWQEAQQNFVITDGSQGSGGGTRGSPPRVLENPAPGSFQSGLGIISGWVCEADIIEVQFNDGSPVEAAYGTDRGDTRSACGDVDNGFGLVFNWNLLGDGVHTVRALADGTEFASVTVTVTTLGAEFLPGVSGEDTIADFPHVGTDTVIRWQESQQNFVIATALPTQQLVDVSPNITIPAGVTSVQPQDINVTSLYSPTGQVRASPDPTLLIAEDADGTVLLSLADMDGGLLGEGQNAVEASLESTAVTLVALAAGYPVAAIDESVVNQITTHAHYSALIAAMTTALAADKNFLDRIFDYPQVVSLIRQVATFRTGTRQAAQQMYQTLSAQYAAVLPDGIIKDDFWCTPGIGGFSLLSDWLCSPWDEHEPWRWFGDAKGLTTFYPDNFREHIGIVSAALSSLGPFAPQAARLSIVAAAVYKELLTEAKHPPFLARSDSPDSPDIYATANPNFVAYALELYQDEEFKNWLYTPRNATMLTKLWNSGAAQREIETGLHNRLNPSINRVRFERYRFTYSAGGNPRLPDRGLALSFLNTFTVIAAAVNLISDTSALLKFLHELPVDEVSEYLAVCGRDLATDFNVRLPEPSDEATVARILEFAKENTSSVMQTTRDCILNSQGTKRVFKKYAWKLARILPLQKVRAFVETAALWTPIGWAKLAFDGANEAMPVFTSYLAPSAGSAEYYIQWEEDDDGPYIARVSETPPDDEEPSAPDLVVGRPSVSVNLLTPGQAFTLSATVRNRGTGASSGTPLRYYRSSNATITSQDTEVDAGRVNGIAPSSTRTVSTNLTVPATAGTYYYGACVESLTDEADTTNNCSSGVRVTVEEPMTKPDVASVSNASATEGNSLTFTVRLSGSTTQPERYYYSTYSGGNTPAEPGDYADADERAVQVPSGRSSFTIQISTNQDADTDDETFYLYVTDERNHPFPAPGPSRHRGTGTIEEPPSALTSKAKMYWIDTDMDTIRQANLDGSQVETLVSGLNRPRDLVLDVAGGKMYWHETRDFDGDGGTPRIQRANLDGSQVETVVSGSDYYYQYGFRFALDVAGGKIYWYDPKGRNTIQRANLDGSRIEPLVSIPALLHNLVLDVAGGKMYWIDGGVYETPPRIQRANLDGSQVETLVSVFEEANFRLYNLALDVAGGKMYWNNWDAETIQRANLNGSQVETLVEDSFYSDLALDVAEGKIYWNNWDAETIQRANLNGSQVETLVSGVNADNPVLDAAGGKMYWHDWSVDTIQRANLDGSQVETLVSGASPDNLVLSYPVP